MPRGHPEFGRLAICDCRSGEQRARLQDRLFSQSRLEELKELSFETFKPKGRIGTSELEQKSIEGAFSRSKHYASRLDGWLLLQGGIGVGKTHLAAAIANQAVADGVPTLFLTVPDLLDELRASYGDGDFSFAERFEQVRTAPLIVLDDFGSQNTTEWA